MRVLRLCSVYEAPAGLPHGFDAIGGMQVHTARLTRALDARGVAHTVITAHRPGAERVQLVSLRSRVLRVGAPIRRFRQLYGVAAIRHVRALRGVDLVHVHLGEDLAIVPLARWAAHRLRAPLVATVHCSLEHTLVAHDARSSILRTIGGPMQTGLLRDANRVLVFSDRLAERLVASSVAGSRIRVIPLGVDLEAPPAPRPASMDGHRWIVYAGRLVAEKGVRDLVSAFGMLRTPGIRLLVVGDGPDRSSLAALSRGDHRIRFQGPIPHAEVGAYLEHANVVAAPSWYEERGRVVLEAMALGTPVVATRTDGTSSSIVDGVEGLLVPARDPARLAGAIERVLNDDALASSISAAAREKASSQGLEAFVQATLGAYESVLGRPAERAPRRALRVR